MNTTKISDCDIANLPDWARGIIKEYDAVRKTAYHERRLYVALRTALHDTLSGNPDEFFIQDKVMKAAKALYERNEKFDDATTKAFSYHLRKRIIADCAKIMSGEADTKAFQLNCNMEPTDKEEDVGVRVTATFSMRVGGKDHKAIMRSVKEFFDEGHFTDGTIDPETARFEIITPKGKGK